ncbi:MAG: chromate transporter [Eubacteriaceae bacterium]|jgi:chromate transporter
MKELLDLFFIFMKVGSVTFGGGLAMLPILKDEFVERRSWCTDEELADYFAVGQCTPGIIAVNFSTFIGYKRRGVTGGFMATIGFITVPLVLLTVISAGLRNFASIPVVVHALAGVRACVVVLICEAVVNLWKTSVVDLPSFLIFAVVAALSLGGTWLPIKLSPVVLVLFAGAAGVLILRARKTGKEHLS